MTPEQTQDIHDRLIRLEADKGTRDVILESINKSLALIQDSMSKQTDKIDRALLYNEKHDNLSKEVETLRKEYGESKRDMDKGFSWLRGSIASAAVMLTIIIGLAMFVAKDGLSGIKDNDMKIQGVVTRLERVETRINMSNPKEPYEAQQQ